MTSFAGRMLRWVRLDRDQFWSEAWATPWTTWLLGQTVVWCAALAVLGLLAALGRPAWSLLSVPIAITGGQGLARIYIRSLSPGGKHR